MNVRGTPNYRFLSGDSDMHGGGSRTPRAIVAQDRREQSGDIALLGVNVAREKPHERITVTTTTGTKYQVGTSRLLMHDTQFIA